MPTITFPYGKETVDYFIPDERLAGELVSQIHRYAPGFSQDELVRHALEKPVGSPPLHVLAENKNKVVIIASDHTRPVPSKIIMPQMLNEIRKGNPKADISVLVSTGCHRESTKEELINKFGSGIYENEKMVIHNCDTSPMAPLGELPSGGKLFLNELAVTADLLVAEGFIEPHFFAGFSGGRKSVMPGVASRETVVYNHNAEFIASPYARAGITENNPIHTDMLFAAKKAGLNFICNVVINAGKEIIYAVAGDCEMAHKKGCGFLNERCKVKGLDADIVITSNGGYPLDQNIYQAVKGMTAAEASVKKDGVIIMLAKSDDGHGGDGFYKTFADEKDLNKLLTAFLSTPKEKTRTDQWQSQIFARVLKHARVIFISDVADDTVCDLHMTPAHSIDEAVKKAEAMLGNKNASIAAIPDGVAVMVV
jgi:nickel-dependent lactate racemase